MPVQSLAMPLLTVLEYFWVWTSWCLSFSIVLCKASCYSRNIILLAVLQVRINTEPLKPTSLTRLSSTACSSRYFFLDYKLWNNSRWISISPSFLKTIGGWESMITSWKRISDTDPKTKELISLRDPLQIIITYEASDKN